MEPTYIRILALANVLDGVEVHGHDNLVRLASAINELKKIGKELQEQAEAEAPVVEPECA